MEPSDENLMQARIFAIDWKDGHVFLPGWVSNRSIWAAYVDTGRAQGKDGTDYSDGDVAFVEEGGADGTPCTGGNVSEAIAAAMRTLVPKF